MAIALPLWLLLLAWTRWAAPHMVVDRPIDTLAYVLVTTNSLLLIRRLATPRAVLAGTAVVSAFYMGLGYPYGPALLPFALAVYTCARHLPWRTAAVACGLAVPTLALHNLGDGAQIADLLGVFPAAGWVIVPFAVGTTVTQRRAAVDRDRREAVERGVGEERLRMAQEVHDIVGHGLAAIKMQADIALHVLAKQPEIARPTLEAVSATSAAALDELRTTLRMLRSTAQASTPGLADLEALYQRMRNAGLHIRATVEALSPTGPPGTLNPASSFGALNPASSFGALNPTGSLGSLKPVGSLGSLSAECELVAYRTIQESLTNVLKHAYPKEADIVLTSEPGALRIRVTSAFTEMAPPGGGLGLAGMRDRVAALGGRLTAEPAPGAVFIVDAWIPA
jgi:signal transduction histidine kinase